MSAAASTKPGRGRSSAKGRGARRAAIQALYQLDMSGAQAAAVIEEFRRHRLSAPDAGVAAASLFATIVEGANSRREELLARIGEAMAPGWSPPRLDAVLRAILLAAAFELAARGEVPARAAIAAYVDLAREFLGEGDTRLANGVLDRLARRLRPGEFTGEESADAVESRPGEG